jgi:hypothetical protein
VDSGVANGIRYQYSVAAFTPSALSTRTMSNVVTAGVVATTGGGTGGGGTGGGGTDTTRGTATGGDTTRTTSTTTTDPLHGRYRVTLTGFTVQAQTYDNPLQLDGKGDEVYFATHVVVVDTAASEYIVGDEVRTTHIYGDVNGFSYRVQAGSAGSTGGLATGNVYPSSTKAAAADFPLVLWEGELVSGRNAVIVVPTVWEWDNNPELFGNWLTGRHAFLSRLLQPEPMAAILLNRDLQPVELGSAGLFVHTNMFGDARDRPVGLSPGAPATVGVGFFPPLVLDPKSGTPTTSYASLSGSIVGAILPSNPFASYSKSLIDNTFQKPAAFGSSLGGTNAKISLASSGTAGSVLQAIASSIRGTVRGVMRTQPGIALRQFAGVIGSSLRSGLSSDLYLFEKMVVLTPESFAAAMAQSKLTNGVQMDVQYVDYGSLQGKYTLHLKVERLP